MAQMTSRRTMHKHYAQGVIGELQQLGYPADQAKDVFFRHYRDMKRTFGLEPNVTDFAKMIDEFERAMKRPYNPNDPNQIYVGHIREQARAKKRKALFARVRTVKIQALKVESLKRTVR
ncbi:hypothetical protein EHV15_35755 [Paenibacillus oralis]|uniref:Uncharacterized protein n=1 Tax=Paenibacillus oralis TaxID=2490856 RepID=A0A3P3TBN6_9BACL|nr:hypothetical protein [Paenibacillus oralis]RRJ54929.1 hypothetical protein EHV15_35755 [Paenibacillus oralis]